MARRTKKKNSGSSLILGLLLLGIVVYFINTTLGFIKSNWKTIAIVGGSLLAVYTLVRVIEIAYVNSYFKGPKFASLSERVRAYIADCNELNEHIEELRSSYVDFRKTDYGEAAYRNEGSFNYKHEGIATAKYAPNIYDCSRQVCDSARKQPFKYVCKYFNIPENEKSLEQFEEILNRFSAAEEGKLLSQKKHDQLLDDISGEVPELIRHHYAERLERELGFQEFEFDEMFYPVFTFRYISSGGNSGTSFDIRMDIPMLERFINYLSDRIDFQNSAKGQRRLMTPALRRFILERDDNTCKKCGNSTRNEQNLLLEVDHIIPIARGGLTTEDNLQTLCWKCNRSKGSKLTE